MLKLVEKLGSDEKYQAWLKENGYTEESKDHFFIGDQNGRIILYKKVAEYQK